MSFANWLYGLENLSIAAAYFAITTSVLALRKAAGANLPQSIRRLVDAGYPFILSCGIGHLIDVLILVVPSLHPLHLWSCGITAVVSVQAAFQLPAILLTIHKLLMERERIEMGKLQAEATFTAFADYSPAIQAIKTVDGIHHWINHYCREQFGDIQGKTGEGWVPQALLEATIQNDLQVWQTQKQLQFVERVPTPNGDDRYWQVCKFPLGFDPLSLVSTDRRFVGLIALDITTQIQANQRLTEYTAQLEASKLKLEAANEELNLFAYVASHDLNAPLRSISGFSERLQKKLSQRIELTDQESQYFENILESCAWMKRLIDDLLKFSQASQKAQALQDVDLRAILDRAVLNLTASIKESAVVLDLSGFPQLGEAIVAGESSQIDLVFQNLLGNAIKFVAVDRPPLIKVRARPVGRFWQVEFEDNGIGIEARFYEKIMQLFQRLHNRDEYPGTGLGLAICKKIIDRHGGTIGVRSVPGSGSVFTVQIAREPIDGVS